MVQTVIKGPFWLAYFVAYAHKLKQACKVVYEEKTYIQFLIELMN